MKKIFNKIVLLLGVGAVLLNTGCTDFLDIQPDDKFTDDNYWTSEQNVKTYSWRFYELFTGYGNGSGVTADFYFQNSSSTGCTDFADDLANRNFINYPTNSSTTSNEWTTFYRNIRAVNVMLQRIPMVPMSKESAKHWEGVGRFFRAYCYFMLVERYGDVPYFSEAAQPNQPEKIYVPRSPRKDVMEKVVNDLKFAVENLREKDGDNTINKYTALALLSRVGLYEGTYMKYHKLGDGSSFLNEAKSAAAKIIASKKFTLTTNFKGIYNSLDLGGNSEILLYKKYLPSILMNSIQAYTNTSTIVNGPTKFAVESYACSDGLPIGQSSNYKGDNSLADVLTNRDKRLLAIMDNSDYGHPDKPLGQLVSSTGYVTNLFNDWSPLTNPGSDRTTIGQNHVDAPIFIYAEVLLNYAEACAELGDCKQEDLDISINAVREKHGGLPKLVISGNDVMVNNIVINDPKRTSELEKISGEVSPLLWEIRRDRRAEFMSWHYIRLYDIYRWHKGEYLDFTANPDVALGAKITTPNLKKTKINGDGYIIPYNNVNRVFVTPKNYLNSIPLNEITLYAAENVKLEQNPGWNK